VAEKEGCLFTSPVKDTKEFATKAQSHKEDYRTSSLRVFVAEKGGCLFTSPVKDTKDIATKSQRHKERF
jgi:hypothetical protein